MTGNLCEVAASQAKATDSTGITAADERSRQPRLPRAFVEIIHYRLKKTKNINQLLSDRLIQFLKGWVVI